MDVYFKIALYIVAFILIIKLLYLFRCIRRRLSFVSRLKREAKKQGAAVEILHFSLRSFLSVYDGEDIIIHRGDEKILIKFFPHFLKERSVTLLDETKLTVKRHLFLFGGRGYGFMPPVMNDASSMFKERTKKYSSLFSETEGKRIMLFSPRPFKVKGIENGVTVSLDNGMPFAHFVIYDQNVFLKNIERYVA